uniref:Protein kinase putative n=1 Tax=Albugo laibachii Nc14 TaxID=890382 RepID=F0W2X0_9STRA|nr:protein kinase putative [Albugo laibachii Nc14]|eukprot:CCA15407.1 protein kinase putative [Albugo laibachii Nc14]
MGLSHLFCGGSYGPKYKRQIVHEGALQYQSRKHVWKERWFSLEANSYGLFKKTLSGRVLLAGCTSQHFVLIQSVQPLSSIRELTDESTSTISRIQESKQHIKAIKKFGFSVLTKKNTWVTFHTATHEEECNWVMTMVQYSHGFTREITEMLTDRKLLDGRYTLIRELGRGASGVVSLHMCQGRPYAIKKLFTVKEKKNVLKPLKPSNITVDEAPPTPAKFRAIPESVRREIAVLKKATLLPYVIQLHDIILDMENKQYYLVMEYMGGGSVAEWDPKEMKYKMAIPHDDNMIRTYFTQVIIALRALHSNGLCHRDIKPENLMVSEDLTTCKVGDLGVAQYFVKEDHVQQASLAGDFDVRDEFPNGGLKKISSINENSENNLSPLEVGDIQSRLSIVLERHEVALTDTKGTYPFLPPEALSNGKYGGFKADIWAAGVTLYALMFEKLPFFSISTLELFEQIQSSSLDFPEACEDNLLKDLLQKMLMKDAHERIDIDQILHHTWLALTPDRVHQHVKASDERRSSIVVKDHEVHSIFSTLQCHIGSKICRKATGKTDNATPLVKPSSNCISMSPSSKIVLSAWIDLESIAVTTPFDWTRLAPILPNATCSGSGSPTSRQENLKNRKILCVSQMMKCITAAGCLISREIARERERQQGHTRMGPLVIQCSKSSLKQPNGSRLDTIRLPWEFDLLMDSIMRSVQDVWAQDLRNQGWEVGEVFDAQAKLHPLLKSFSDLNDDEKAATRRGIALTLKKCLVDGYEFSFQRRMISGKG